MALRDPLRAPGFLSRHFGKKCPTCGKRGYSDYIDSQVLSRAPGIETVTRTTKVKNAEGEVVRTIEREVDVPVVHVRTRYNYHCYNCNANWHQIIRRTHEGVLPPAPRHETMTKETITREVVKVPCRYCGTLNVLATDKFCSGCGSPVK